MYLVRDDKSQVRIYREYARITSQNLQTIIQVLPIRSRVVSIYGIKYSENTTAKPASFRLQAVLSTCRKLQRAPRALAPFPVGRARWRRFRSTTDWAFIKNGHLRRWPRHGIAAIFVLRGVSAAIDRFACLRLLFYFLLCTWGLN